MNRFRRPHPSLLLAALWLGGVLACNPEVIANQQSNPDHDFDGDGVTEADGDCDDGDSAVLPGAQEICNGVDDDCDGSVDEDAVDATTWYPDIDMDGFGNPVGGEESCEPVEDRVTDNTDCDDDDSDVNPSATEVCDGVDNDCDENEDEDLGDGTIDTAVVGFEWWYWDQDGDGYGDPDEEIYGCGGSDYVDNAEDCDDADETVNPEADEVCDGVDNNCSGEVDVDASDMLTCHLDSDGDGYGRSHEGYQLVECTCPSGWVDNADDCDDEDADLTTDCR